MTKQFELETDSFAIPFGRSGPLVSPQAVIDGTSKADTINGTSGDDTINGKAGSDSILAARATTSSTALLVLTR